MPKRLFVVTTGFLLIAGIVFLSDRCSRPRYDGGDSRVDLPSNGSIFAGIMQDTYGVEHGEIDDAQYQKCKKLYVNLSDKLNNSIRDDPRKVVALSAISKSLFTKRDTVRLRMINEQPERCEEMMGRYSSFNAMVRDEIRKGSL